MWSGVHGEHCLFILLRGFSTACTVLVTSVIPVVFGLCRVYSPCVKCHPLSPRYGSISRWLVVNRSEVQEHWLCTDDSAGGVWIPYGLRYPCVCIYEEEPWASNVSCSSETYVVDWDIDRLPGSVDVCWRGHNFTSKLQSSSQLICIYLSTNLDISFADLNAEIP